jgi:diguanylate cyclase (GGDEF)-like protein
LNTLIKKLTKQFSVEFVAFLYDSYVILFHVALQIIFYLEKNAVLQYLNIVSISIYVILFIFFLFKKIKIVYIVTILEIVIFGLICNTLLGKELLFYTYSIAVMPIMIVYVYYSRCIIKIKDHIYLYTILTFISLATMFFSELSIDNSKAIYQLSNKTIKYLFFANSLNIISAVIFGSVLFLIIAISMHNRYEKIIKENSYLAEHDTLTGLLNRNALNTQLDLLKENNIEFGIAIADIDDFKKINDNYGHDCGDYILKNISNIFSDYYDDELKMYRFGGEEVVFVYTKKEDIFNLFEDIRKKINLHNFSFNEQKIKVSVTFGVSIKGNDFESLFKEADEKLYNGKNNGKNMVVH